MDEIREVCAQIRRHELSSEGRASAEGEAAARAVLLVTIAAALLLLVFFAIGFAPFIGIEPRAKWRPWPLRYGAAMLAVGAAFLMRAALTPFIGPTAVPFITFFPAVLFAGWFGGFRAGALAVVLSTLASDYFFVERVNSFVMRRGDDLIAVVIFVLVGFGMALLGHSQRHAVQRAEQERQRFETTLGSIGDAVIVTDADGRVTLANNIALTLMGCTESEVAGKALGQFFQIVNEFTRAAVEIPVAKVAAGRGGCRVGKPYRSYREGRDRGADRRQRRAYSKREWDRSRSRTGIPGYQRAEESRRGVAAEPRRTEGGPQILGRGLEPDQRGDLHAGFQGSGYIHQSHRRKTIRLET